MRNIYSIYKEHYKALISLGLPIVIGQIGVIVLGFADTLMIGHHSTIELGAASFVNNVFNLVIIFSTGFSYGLTPIVGGLYGTHQYASAGQALRNSLLANLLVAFLLTIGMTVLYFNVGNLGQPEELIPLIKPYYLVLLASLVFVMLFNGFKQFTDGITDTKTAMWILLGGNVLNTGLIDNLPPEACVEVPCLVDGSGITPCHVGRLPIQLAAMNMTHINVHLMTIEAARTKKKEDIYRAAMLDPHTAAELSIDDIVKMCDDLIEAHGDYMAMYK